MKRIAFVISLLSISCTIALAQQNYFVFIQSNKQQPFYVRFQEKTYSSSAIGHLVLPRLGDSTYQLSIGFPRNAYPERDFMVPINQKDHSYQLKEVEGQGWILQDEQSMSVVQPQPGPATNGNLGLGERKTGDFATLMSSLVNDTTVMYTTLVKADAPKPVTPIAKPDTAVVFKEAAAATDSTVAVAVVDSSKTDTAKAIVSQPVPTPDTAVAMVVDPVVHKPAADTQAVTKVAIPEPKASIVQVQERLDEKAKEIVFVDSSAAGVDTVSVSIALEKDPVKPVTKPATIDSAISTTNTAAATTHKTDSSRVVITTPPVALDTVAAIAKKDTVATKPKAVVLFNSDCTNFATEQDVDKLRVKMLASNSVDDKIGAAKKIFKTKCFVTRYIKGLSELFPNDESRFKFFEAAYPFVSDTSSFRELVDLLSSELYVARFKAMVRM